MISDARQNSEDQPDITPLADDYIAPAPRVSVQAFCETAETAATVRAAAEKTAALYRELVARQILTS